MTRASIFLLALATAPAARAEDVVFPKDAGVLNVRDFGAKGDGRVDDSEAFQKALDAFPNGGKIVYVPAGTYRITRTLNWPHGTQGGWEEKNTILQGQSRDKSILRLPDACPGFDDPKSPRAMIWTGQAPAQRFRNAVRNLTFDTGSKNPGATGLRFMANNQGCVRDVTIRSGDGSGAVGLDLAYTDENGPCLIKNVEVSGFDFGVRAAHAVDGLTIEHLSLKDQRRFGLSNEGQCLSIRGLTSHNAVPAVVNAGDAGLLVLVDADLRSPRGGISRPAVMNEAFLYARNVSSVGYAETIRNAANDRHPPPGRVVAEFSSHDTPGLDPTGRPAAPLAVRETPEVPWGDLKDWANPVAFGAIPNDGRDDSEAIQKAIDSGKSTIYLPNGNYNIGRTVRIRGAVRRLIGCEAGVIPEDLKGEPAFRVEAGSVPVVVFERLWGGYATTPMLDNASSRTLVVKDCCNVSGHFTGKGDIFLEDVCSNPFTDWRFSGQKVWARQFNVENEGLHVLNDGGSLWVLGFKTERGGTLVSTRSGGSTEILGGLCYTTTDPKDAPMFTLDIGDLRVTLGESCFTGKPYQGLVSSARPPIARGAMPMRTGGSLIPLFTSPSRK